MKTFTTLAAFGVLALAFAAPVHAQQAAPMKDIMTADHSMRASKLIGMAVYNDSGEKIGSVIEVLVRNTAAEPLAILSVGDFVGGTAKLVAVPVSKVNLEGNQPMMKGATKAMLRDLPSYSGQFGSG